MKKHFNFLNDSYKLNNSSTGLGLVNTHIRITVWSSCSEITPVWINWLSAFMVKTQISSNYSRLAYRHDADTRSLLGVKCCFHFSSCFVGHRYVSQDIFSDQCANCIPQKVFQCHNWEQRNIVFRTWSWRTVTHKFSFISLTENVQKLTSL